MAQLDVLLQAYSAIGVRVSGLQEDYTGTRHYVLYVDGEEWDSWDADRGNEDSGGKSAAYLIQGLNDDTSYNIQFCITPVGYSEGDNYYYEVFVPTDPQPVSTSSKRTSLELICNYIYDWDIVSAIDLSQKEDFKQTTSFSWDEIEEMCIAYIPSGYKQTDDEYAMDAYFCFYDASDESYKAYLNGDVFGGLISGSVAAYQFIAPAIIEYGVVPDTSRYLTSYIYDPWGTLLNSIEQRPYEKGASIQVIDIFNELIIGNIYSFWYAEINGELCTDLTDVIIVVEDEDILINFYLTEAIFNITLRVYCDTPNTCKSVFVKYNGTTYESAKHGTETYAECVVPGNSEVMIWYIGHKSTSSTWYRCYGWYDGPGGSANNNTQLSPIPVMEKYIVPNDPTQQHNIYCFVAPQTPGTFEWDQPKESQGIFSLTANEWNRLCAYIVAKENNGGGYVFVKKGDTFTYQMYATMANLTDTDASGFGSADPIKAEYLNDLRDNANKKTPK